MRLDRFLTLYFFRPLRALGLRSGGGRRLPVLMYHSISDDPEPNFSPYYKVCTSPQRFAEHMQWLADDGYRGVTLTEGLEWLNEGERGREQGGGTREQESGSQNSEARIKNPTLDLCNPCNLWSKIRMGFRVENQESNIQNQKSEPSSAGAKDSGSGVQDLGFGIQGSDNPESKIPNPKSKIQQPVAITFDDGFRDFHTAAVPAMQRHGFTATMYLPTAFIGDERRSFKGRECLTWSEVRELHSAGMEFGSHTVNHPMLVELDWPEIERELRESKAMIEQQLGRPSNAFAYPFAFPQANVSFRTRFLAALRTAGYKSCVTTEVGTIKPQDEPLQLKRLPANSCDDAALFVAKLAGAYDWVGRPQKAMKHFKSMRLRRQEHSVKIGSHPH